MIALALALLKEVPWKAWAVAGAVVIILGAGLAARSYYIEKGATDAVARINAANVAAKLRADEASTSLGACPLGRWDRSRGVCLGAGQ